MPITANAAWDTPVRAGYLGRPRLSKSISAQNTFTDATYFDKKPFTVSVSGSFSGTTVTLQKSYDDGSTWHDVEAYTAASEKIVDNVDGSTKWRLGVKTGGYSAGPVVCKLLQ